MSFSTDSLGWRNYKLMTVFSSNTDLGSYEESKHKAVVRVPIGKVLSFPNMCVKCGKNEPDSNFTVKHILYYSKAAIFGLYSEKENFPAHKKCATALKGRQIALCFVFIFLTVCAIYFIPEGYPRKTPLLFMVPFILGYVIWQEISPPSVSLSTVKGMKIFEFKSKEYGKEFATINDIANKNIAQPVTLADPVNGGGVTATKQQTNEILCSFGKVIKF